MAQLSWQLWSSRYNLRSLWLPTTWTYLCETAWQRVFNFYKIICPIEHKGSNFRNSRLEVFCKKGVLRNFAKFTGKHLCQSLFFNKVACLRPTFLLKKRLWHRCFHVNFAKLQEHVFLQNTTGGCFCKETIVHEF